jgi:hypothetical protein
MKDLKQKIIDFYKKVKEEAFNFIVRSIKYCKKLKEKIDDFFDGPL